MPIKFSFFDIPVDHLYASGIFVPYMKGLHIENLSIAAPDMGEAGDAQPCRGSRRL